MLNQPGRGTGRGGRLTDTEPARKGQSEGRDKVARREV